MGLLAGSGRQGVRECLVEFGSERGRILRSQNRVFLPRGSFLRSFLARLCCDEQRECLWALQESGCIVSMLSACLKSDAHMLLIFHCLVSIRCPQKMKCLLCDPGALLERLPKDTRRHKCKTGN